MTPSVSINLFVHNGAATVAAAIDSVLAQTWTDWSLTLIDDGSTDATPAILRQYAETHPNIALKRNRCNTGAVGAFQRAFQHGDAPFVMLKSADDLIAPEFIERVMSVLLDHPGCVMAHAAALSFHGAGTVDFEYPPSHRLHAADPDPVLRAAHVMATYTSSPSFWGIYRRAAVDHLAPIACRAGWDHVLLAELALYGEIRHTPDVLYWRRGKGRPVRDLARAATLESIRGLPLDDLIADPLWRLPCITTAYAHLENFAVARVSPPVRNRLMAAASDIFTTRWRPTMLREICDIRGFFAVAADRAADADPLTCGFAALQLARLLTAIAAVLPETDLRAERRMLSDLISGRVSCPA